MPTTHASSGTTQPTTERASIALRHMTSPTAHTSAPQASSRERAMVCVPSTSMSRSQSSETLSRASRLSTSAVRPTPRATRSAFLMTTPTTAPQPASLLPKAPTSTNTAIHDSAAHAMTPPPAMPSPPPWTTAPSRGPPPPTQAPRRGATNALPGQTTRTPPAAHPLPRPAARWTAR